MPWKPIEDAGAHPSLKPLGDTLILDLARCMRSHPHE
jgi:hypothetical protein